MLYEQYISHLDSALILLIMCTYRYSTAHTQISVCIIIKKSKCPLEGYVFVHT